MEDLGELALGHTRLSILDLSNAGSQPMVSASGRYVMSYNGEVYNFPEIRLQLAAHGYRFRGTSDTEIILCAVEHWGLFEALERFAGMFAFSLWDRRLRRLSLVRDRFGIKPLYIHATTQQIAFGSEIAALTGWGSRVSEVEPSAVKMLLQLGYIPAPLSIFRGIEKVLPGTVVEFEDQAGSLVRRTRQYWSAMTVALEARENHLTGTDTDLVEEMRSALSTAVSQHMVSDVPVGAFLSGGLDSGAIASVMPRTGSLPRYTFTVVNDDVRYDESREARCRAERIGSQHVEVRLDPTELLSIAMGSTRVYSEPFADYSQIPTVAVCRVAREYVKVVLTGDGGDELFAGYNRHRWIPEIAKFRKLVPKHLRHFAAGAIGGVSPAVWDMLNRIAPSRLPRLMGIKARKLAEGLSASTIQELYDNIVFLNRRPEALLVDDPDDEHRLLLPNSVSAMEAVQLADTMRYLPDDILTKVDRASMSVGLETRVPMLDHRVYELAWRLPSRAKLRGRESKWILRRIVEEANGEQLRRLPKTGFGVPLDDWLRGPLKEWAHDLLSPATVRRHGFFREEKVTELLEQHISGRENVADRLWPLLVFQSWVESRA